VRITHWLVTIAFFALLLSGTEVLLSHPRFYWGEIGNVNTQPLFTIPVPSSRATVPTGYGYVLPDQNGWSRYLHFQAAWLALFTGVAYVLIGARTGHFRRNLVPVPADRSWRALRSATVEHLRFAASTFSDRGSYNALQRIAYLVVVFVLFPLVIWTGLAMSPGFTAAVPASVTLLGGRQSARTLHLFISIALVLFTLVHVAMIIFTGFSARMRAMITGAAEARSSAPSLVARSWPAGLSPRARPLRRVSPRPAGATVWCRRTRAASTVRARRSRTRRTACSDAAPSRENFRAR
jgi:thiosulfate reductase cytochrome b subunit